MYNKKVSSVKSHNVTHENSFIEDYLTKENQRILDKVSKIVSEAPKLFQALGKDSFNFK